MGFNSNDLSIIISIIALFPLGFLYHERKKHQSYYSVTWKLSNNLNHSDLLNERPYNDFYSPRDFDCQISDALKKHQNILLIGQPLAGKTRAIHEVLKNCDEYFDVLIPKCREFDPDSFVIPHQARFWRKGVVILDDLQRFVQQEGFENLLRSFIQKKFIIIATSRTGIEYHNVENEFASCGIHINSVFEKNIIEIPLVDEISAKEIAQKNHIDWITVSNRFNGTIGSIFLRLDEMQKRFNTASDNERNVLRSIKNLYICGVYNERDSFPIIWVRKTLSCNDTEWNKLIETLVDKEFIKVERESIVIDPVYIEEIISSVPDTNYRVLCQNISKIFKNDPKVLLKIGDHLMDIRIYFSDQSYFLKNVIILYRQVLDNFSETFNSSENGQIKRNLGSAYRNLAEFEERKINCIRAVEAFEDALKIFTLDKNPFYFSTIKNDLGVAFGTLADVEDKAKNSKRAIAAFNESLKIRTTDEYPLNYATTQNNLGNAYRTLSEIEDKITNCKLAINAYTESLKIFTFETVPMEYATTHNNLGCAYWALADVEDKSTNCKRAIAEFQKSLQVFSIERFPLDYAMTQSNMGAAYSALADIEDISENSKHAIQTLFEVLKIYTIEKFPMQYAMAYNNLGTAYSSLSQIEDKIENSHLAVDAFKESLKIYTIERFPMDYAMTQNNIGIVFGKLAVIENKGENCRLSLAAFNESLKIFTIDSFPIQHNDVLKNRQCVRAHL